MYNIKYINTQQAKCIYNFENTKEKVLKKNAARVKKSQIDAQLILSIFRQLCVFRTYLGPSSRGATVCIQQLVLIILFR